ncbi:MAG: HdeD family acid-resistance protein [Candidatus Binatia bacterium]
MEQAIQLTGVGELKRSWGWFLALGIALIVLGTIALGSALVMTIASVFFFGWLMIIAGVMEAVHAFWRKRWAGFFLDLLTGILYVVVGWMMVTNPKESALLLTLIIAMFLLFEGVFRIVAALSARYPHWGWVLLNGVISLVLGLMIWRQWPYSGLWVIGLFVGIEMLFNGWSLVMLSLASRRLPEEAPAAGRPLSPQSA